MTSGISKDDIEDAIYRAGIKSPHLRARIMRMVDTYARTHPGVPEDILPPVDLGEERGYKYKCPSCNERKYVADYPPYKKDNPRSPVPCLECTGKKL